MCIQVGFRLVASFLSCLVSVCFPCISNGYTSAIEFSTIIFWDAIVSIFEIGFLVDFLGGFISDDSDVLLDAILEFEVFWLILCTILDGDVARDEIDVRD